MKLSKRLQTIFDMLPSGGVAADIGSDHGKLIISLFLEGKIKKGYAVENKKGPFLRLEKEIKANNVLENVIPMLSDGISELPSDVDKVIVAGMGGHLINSILNSHKENLKNVEYIIVDPHNATKEVRKSLISLGYYIYDEKMVYEDYIYYEIILLKKGNSRELSDLELEFGPILIKKKDEVFMNKYQGMVDSLSELLKRESIPEKRKEYLEKTIERIKKVL